MAPKGVSLPTMKGFVMSVILKRILPVVAVITLIGVAGYEWAAHRVSERRYQISLEIQRTLDRELRSLRTMNQQLGQTLTDEQQRVADLTRELTAKRDTLAATSEQLSHAELAVQEFEDRLLALQRQFDLLQGELVVALQQLPEPAIESDIDQMVHLEKVVISPSAPSGLELEGRVVSIHPEWEFMVIDLGWDIVRIGDVVSIYRHDALLGKARIERVQEAMSAATLLPEWQEAELAINDVVRVL